jgi:hypothetical protein
MDTNIKYLIFDLSEIDKIDFNQILITSFDTMRKSLDNTKGIIKWVGDEPSFISSLNSKSIIYSNKEMLSLLNEPEWTPSNSISGTTSN